MTSGNTAPPDVSQMCRKISASGGNNIQKSNKRGFWNSLILEKYSEKLMEFSLSGKKLREAFRILYIWKKE